MQITIQPRDAERMCEALTQTINDLVALAAGDAQEAPRHLADAEAFAGVLFRFAGGLKDGAVAEARCCDDDSDEQRELRLALARRGNPPNVSPIFVHRGQPGQDGAA